MDAGNGLAEALADSLDALVAVVDVGLAPEQEYPHSISAGVEAVEWLLRQIDERLGPIGEQVDPTRIMIGGAGGGGAMAASISLSTDVGMRLRLYRDRQRRNHRWYTDSISGASEPNDDRVFAGCLLITPMLQCPNHTTASQYTLSDGTSPSKSFQQWSGSKAQAEGVGASVMSSAQVDWSWEMYAGAHSGGVAGCASSVECSPSSATDAQLKAASFRHLLLLTASQDALSDEGAHTCHEFQFLMRQ